MVRSTSLRLNVEIWLGVTYIAGPLMLVPCVVESNVSRFCCVVGTSQVGVAWRDFLERVYLLSDWILIYNSSSHISERFFKNVTYSFNSYRLREIAFA